MAQALSSIYASLKYPDTVVLSSELTKGVGPFQILKTYQIQA